MTFRTRLARIGYVLGTALAVTAIVYFFASNWSGLAREAKTLLAVCLTAGFYGLAFLPARLPLWRKHGDFLPLVFLFAGIWAFGASALLLDHIYNTQHDGWRLLAVWFVPALLFAALIRNVWFFALAYGIGHLALWAFFYPGEYFISYTDWQQAGIFALFGAVNLALFRSADRGMWRAGFLKPVSLGVFLAAAVWLSNGFVLGDLGRWLNLLSIAVLFACFLAFGRRRDSLGLSLTGLAASFFAVLKFLELMEEHYSEWFFFFGLVFVALLLAGNVLFFRFVARLGKGGGQAGEGGASANAAETPATGGAPAGESPAAGAPADGTPSDGMQDGTQIDVVPAAGPQADGTEPDGPPKDGIPAEGPASFAADPSDAGSTAARVVGAVVTVVGSIIGAVSLIGLLMLLGESWNNPEAAVFGVGALLVVLMAFLPRLQATVRNTGLMIGLVTATFSVLPHDEAWVPPAVLALGVLAWFRLRGAAAKIIAQVLIQLTFVFFCLVHLEWYGREAAWMFLILAAANGAAYGLHGRVRAPEHRRPLYLGSLVSMLVTLYWLTFLEDVFRGSHALFNAGFFILATALLIRSVRMKNRFETGWFMAFWFLFIGFKYYDWLWDLLHKSLTLLAGSLVLIAASALLDGSADRRTRRASGAERTAGAETGPDASDGEAEQTGTAGRPGEPDASAAAAQPGAADAADAAKRRAGRPYPLLPYRRLLAVLVLLALQAAYVGGEIAVRETQYANGTAVTLAIPPDERIYWQDDGTAWTRYAISNLPRPLAEEFRESGMAAGRRLKLVLRPDAEGIYQIDRLYREGEAVRPGEVVIRGRYDGWGGVRYGIETLSREGAYGIAPERPRFVEVRVSSAGNAVVTDLWAKPENRTKDMDG